MSLKSERAAELKSYLLGELSQEERAWIEERLFIEGAYFEELQATADDLIDDYIYEDLSTNERDKFEAHFLSTEQHREDLRIAKALKQYIAVETTQEAAVVAPGGLKKRLTKVFFFPLPRSPLARLSLAAIVLIALACTIWLIIGNMRRQRQSTPLDVRQLAPRTTESQPNVARDSPSGNPPEQPGPKEKEVRNSKDSVAVTSPSPPSLPGKESPARSLAILLSPGGLVRGGGDTNRVSLPSNVRSVTLRLPLIYAEKYRTYFATLQSEGVSVHTWNALTPTDAETGKEILLKVPAKILQPQTYYIKLGAIDETGGLHDISTYTFVVDHRGRN